MAKILGRQVLLFLFSRKAMVSEVEATVVAAVEVIEAMVVGYIQGV